MPQAASPDHGERANQSPRLLLQRRRLGLDLLQGLPNLAEFGAPTRVHHLRDALARRNQSPGVYGWQIVAARPFEAFRVRRRRLPHRDRFSGKERFVHAQIDGAPEDGVGRHAISLGEDEDVAAGDLAAGQTAADAFPDDQGPGAGQVAQGVQSPLRAALLDNRDRHNDENEPEEHQCVAR